MYVVWLVAAAAAINVCVCVEHQQPSSRGGSLFLSFMFIFTSFEKKNMITFVYMRQFRTAQKHTTKLRNLLKYDVRIKTRQYNCLSRSIQKRSVFLVYFDRLCE